MLQLLLPPQLLQLPMCALSAITVFNTGCLDLKSSISLDIQGSQWFNVDCKLSCPVGSSLRLRPLVMHLHLPVQAAIGNGALAQQAASSATA